MDSLDSIRSLFTGRVERRGGSYVIEVPRDEVDLGAVSTDDVYRVAVLESPDREDGQATAGRSVDSPAVEVDRSSRPVDSAEPEPPVHEGDVVAVTIDDVGDEGDGIARVGAGYILFVSDAEPGEKVAVEVTTVRDTYAFGDVVGDVDVGRASPPA